MQNWMVIEEEYLNYLRSVEKRIPFSNYGEDKYKPFFGKLFSVEGLAYVTQISHPQPRHKYVKNNLDFYKIYIPDSNPLLPDRFVAVVNLNYMFPIKEELLVPLKYAEIDKHREFSTEIEKSLYIDLLKKELVAINKLPLEKKALSLYNLKKDKPDHPGSLRCIDFQSLEKFARDYKKE